MHASMQATSTVAPCVVVFVVLFLLNQIELTY